jgi:hypothetical protein
MKSPYELKHYGVKGMKWRRHLKLTKLEKLQAELEGTEDLEKALGLENLIRALNEARGVSKDEGGLSAIGMNTRLARSEEEVYDEFIKDWSPAAIKKGMGEYEKGMKIAIPAMKLTLSNKKIQELISGYDKGIDMFKLGKAKSFKIASAGKAKMLEIKKNHGVATAFKRNYGKPRPISAPVDNKTWQYRGRKLPTLQNSWRLKPRISPVPPK